MSKRQSSKYKVSRRLGVALWGGDKDPFNKRNYGPGQHGPTGRRHTASNYGTQLKAKQQLKGYYGNISEKQFRAIYKEAIRLKGDSGEHLIGLLERRLDTVVYRLNFVPTVFAARQFVNHRHVTVNGKVVNIPSYKVKEGDVIEIREKSLQIPAAMEAMEAHQRQVPDYLRLDAKHKGTFVRTPRLADVPYPVMMDPKLVVEYYSR